MSGDHLKILTSDVEVRISDLPPGWFWSSTIIGATAEDLIAHDRGDMTPERREELAKFGMEAREKLFGMEVPGANEWMAPRRRAN